MDIALALQYCRPGAQWTCGETYRSIRWDDTEQTKPTEEELAQAWLDYLAEQETPRPKLVTTISNAQMRLWLVENGHYAAVTGYINNIADPTARLKAQIEFQSRATVERNHPLVLAVGQILGLNASELDAAFQQASLL